MKVLLLDFDGVISQGTYFSEIYSEEFGVDINKILPFFDQKKDLTNTGEADLKELLSGVLDDWQWKGTVDELLDYWFNSDSEVDERVRKVAEDLRKKGVQVYLATDQEKYRTEFIWNNRNLKDWIDGKFVSFEMGCTKSDPIFFKTVLEQLNVPAEEIVFFDDSKSKVEAAKKVGINGILYTDFEKFREETELLLSNQ